MAAIKTVASMDAEFQRFRLPVENAARFSTLQTCVHPGIRLAPRPISEAECRCCGGGCEAGRRARREGQDAPSCRAPGAAPERGKRSEAE